MISTSRLPSSRQSAVIPLQLPVANPLASYHRFVPGIEGSDEALTSFDIAEQPLLMSVSGIKSLLERGRCHFDFGGGTFSDENSPASFIR